jgi:hypothetical protein
MFLVIFGWRRTSRRLAVATAGCRHCGGDVPYSVYKEVTKATLFLVPLFPIRVQYWLQCPSCLQEVGASPFLIPRARAMDLIANAAPDTADQRPV